MNTKNENNIINDKKLDAVTGGTITVNDFSAEMTVMSGSGDHCHFEPVLSNFAGVTNREMPKPNPDEKYVLSGKPTADEIISELKS